MIPKIARNRILDFQKGYICMTKPAGILTSTTKFSLQTLCRQKLFISSSSIHHKSKFRVFSNYILFANSIFAIIFRRTSRINAEFFFETFQKSFSSNPMWFISCVQIKTFQDNGNKSLDFHNSIPTKMWNSCKKF